MTTTYYGTLLVILHIFTATTATVHALLVKSDSRAALGWIGVILFFPYAGAILYLLFGINRVRRKAQKRGILGIPWTEEGFTPLTLPREAAPRPLENVGQYVTANKLIDGNRIDILCNGEEAFPAMLDAIAQARKQVLLMTYIFDNDATGRRFVEALGAALARGVKVRVLIDDVGRHYSFPSILRHLKKAQIPVRRFMPVKLVPPSLSLNLRNHRKLLIVDHELGFAGGMNIGDRQLFAHPDGHGASDLHFRFTGPIVHAFGLLFRDDWLRARGSPFDVPPAPGASVGECRCRMIPDGPDNNLDHLSMTLAGVFSAAQHRIRIMTPYFLPDRKLIGALQGAALRGVDVCVIVPSTNNWKVVQWALRHILWELINVGVRVLYQPPPFAHSKCVLIDDDYALIGSTNLDPRSLRLNFELGIEVFSKSFNARLSEHVARICELSAPVTREQLKQRSVPAQLRDAVAALFSPYM